MDKSIKVVDSPRIDSKRQVKRVIPKVDVAEGMIQYKASIV